MEGTRALDERGEPAALASAPPKETGLLADARSLWQEWHGLLHDQFALAALEAKLAGRSLVSMVVAGMMLAVLLVSAWLGLMGVVALWLVGAGVPPSVAVLLAVAANLVLALILCERIRQHSRNLEFPRTVRGLRPGQASLERPERT